MTSHSIPLSIKGTGSFLPGPAVSSLELDQTHGLRQGHLEQETGVKSRHFACEISQIDMAVCAAKRALAQADLPIHEIDLVISASGIPFQTLPSTAPLIMRELGMPDGQAAGFDVNSTCTSFLSALETAGHRIAAGTCRHALIVSSEVASRGLPWADHPEVAALFGDGAAAAVIGPADHDRAGLRACHMSSYPSKYEACQIAAGGTRIDFHNDPETFARHTLFEMNGTDLFRVTLRHFPDFVDTLLQQAGWRKEDVDLVVPHQASPHALRHMIDHSGFGADKIINLAETVGNQIAASLPTALDHARRAGRVPQGARVLMLGTSAGVSFAGLALQV